MKKLLALLLLFGIVGCASVLEVSQRDPAPISFAKIVPDYEEMTSYKAQAKNLKTGATFSVGNLPTSFAATRNAISGCERLFKSQCIIIKNNDIIID